MFSLYGNINYEKFGASLAMISVFTSLARSFDVVSDPLMSYLTDSTRTRFGRRRPFMLVGSFFYSICLFLLMKPPYGNSVVISSWFGITYILYFLSLTFTTIPYFALGPELSRNSDERTSLSLMMSIFEGLGTLVAMAMPLAAKMQVQSKDWNTWVCKKELEQSTLCFSGESCGHIFEGHNDWDGFKPNDTLGDVLAPLAASSPALPTDRFACSEWFDDPSNLTRVLGNMSTVVQNEEFCNCMVTCDSACEVADDRTGFEWVGIIFASYFIVAMVVCVLVVKERVMKHDVKPPPLVPAMFNTIMNAPFRVLLPAWACDAFVNAVVQTMTPFFVMIVTAPKYQTEKEHGRECMDTEHPTYNAWFCETTNVITVCGVCILLAAVLALPIWNLLVWRLGKVKTWLLWSLTGAITNLSFVVLGRGHVIGLWIVSALNGAPLGAKFIADSILGDIIDYDEFLTGQRNEATYFMFKGFLPKIVQIPAAAMPIALLGAFGYKSPVGGVEQLQDLGVTIYVKVVVFTCFVVSLLAFMIKRRYPLKTSQHITELVNGLEAHEKGKPYPDPVTKLEYKPIHVSEHLQDIFWLLDHFRQARIRRMFVKKEMQWAVVHSEQQGEQLEKAIEIKEGSERMLFAMYCQLATAIILLILSSAATGGGMLLISNPTWNFLPTFTAVALGLSIVGIVIAFLRVKAARSLRDAAEKGELTTHIVSQVLLQRDILSHMGVNNEVGNDENVAGCVQYP